MTQQASVIQDLGNSVTRIQYPQLGIIELCVGNSQRASIDTWYAEVIQLVKSWPDDEPYRVLHNAKNVFFSPYFRKQAEAISAKTVELRGTDYPINIAILMADNPTSQLIRLFMKRFLEKTYEAWRVKLFTKHEEAIAWLSEQG